MNARSVSPRKIRILNIPVCDVTVSEALAIISEYIGSKQPHLIVTLGTEMVMAAQKNLEFRNVIESASLVLPDGGGLLWASRRLKTPLREKAAGIELIRRICSASAQKNWRLFFLGGAPGIAQTAGDKLRRQFPGLNIVGIHHGYFQEDNEILNKIMEAKPDILLAALGFPRQEIWLNQHLSHLKIPVGIGVGGSFDVIAGKLKRAPNWMIRLNLEWLFRFFQEPRRYKRILNIPVFMSRVYREVLRKRFLKS